MALGDLVLYRQRSMDSMGGGHLGPPGPLLSSSLPQQLIHDLARRTQVEDAHQPAEEDSRFVNGPGVSHLPTSLYLCDLRHDADEASNLAALPAESGVVSRWRMKDRVSSCIPFCITWKHLLPLARVNEIGMYLLLPSNSHLVLWRCGVYTNC